jgi:hypothetical protein
VTANHQSSIFQSPIEVPLCGGGKRGAVEAGTLEVGEATRAIPAIARGTCGPLYTAAHQDLWKPARLASERSAGVSRRKNLGAEELAG